ncbi:MAG: Gfo/Idh/MocA family oxidoreductase [Polyangiaceae bacterium]
MSSERIVRYAVVGQGFFAQSAILPAFKGAPNSKLVALVSDDLTKQDELGKRYDAEFTLGYEDFDAFLATGAVDAVYIALPNALHADYAVRAARAKVHVLCEKPMALNERECQSMIQASLDADVKLMVAYRLHFEPTNLETIEIVKSGQIGEPRAFTAAFTMQVQPGNVRVRSDLGGGPLFDIGIYCINAARYIFRDEPVDVIALGATRSGDPRFLEVEEQVGAILRFPNDRLATFVAGFGAADAGWYEVLGAEGRVRVDPAFEVAEALQYELFANGKSKKRTFDKRDQVAAELIYFSDCILQNRYPEPSGVEGLADVRIIHAILESEASGRAVAIEPVVRRARPEVTQQMKVSAHKPPKLVHATPPSRH